MEAPASLSTVQAVTVTKPAPRLSGLGDSSFSLTRAAVICQNFAETFLIISITSAEELFHRENGRAQCCPGHAESLPHILHSHSDLNNSVSLGN